MTEDQENQSAKYHLGDMLWGRVSGHPWWPCMVAKGPDSPSYFRTIKRRQNIQVRYHVQYFGEENERGWLGEASLMPYEGRAAFEKMQEERLNPNTGGNPSKKDRKNFVIAFRRQKSWSTAVVQAEEALALSSNERLERYTFAYPAITEDQQTPKTVSPRKRKRLSSSRSSIDGLDSLNGFPNSSQSESLIEMQEGETEEGNDTDSSSAAVSLARTGVRSGRAIKHTSRFAKHLHDIMKKKSRNSLQKSSTPSNSQDSSFNTLNSRDLPVDLPVIKIDRSEQSPARQISRSLTRASNRIPTSVVTVSPIAMAPPAVTTGVNSHEAPIKIEPVSDPFMEAQMLHLQQQRLLLQNNQQFQQQMRQLPQQNHQHSHQQNQQHLHQQNQHHSHQQHSHQQNQQQKQSFPVISVEPLDSERDANLQCARPPKKRQKVNHVFSQKVILITPIPDMQDETSPIKEPVAPVIIQPKLMSCSVAVNTDIDMKCLDRMLTELADRGPETLSQPLESADNMAEQPVESTDSGVEQPMESTGNGEEEPMKSMDNGVEQPMESTGNGVEQPMEVGTCDDLYCIANVSSSETEVQNNQNLVSNVDCESLTEEHLTDKIEEADNNQNTTSNEVIIDSSPNDLAPSASILEGVHEEVDMQANEPTSHCPVTSKSKLEEEIVDTTNEIHDTTRDATSPTSAVGHTLENLVSTNDIYTQPTTGHADPNSQEHSYEMTDEIDSLQSEEAIVSTDGLSEPMSEEDMFQSCSDEEDHRYQKSIPKATVNASDSVVISPLYGVMLRASPRHVVKLVEVVIEEVSELTPTKRICHQCNCRGEDLVECQGPCQGVFHPICLGVSTSSQGPIKCGHCTTGCHVCFICKTSSLDLVACSARDCGKFYHKECLSKVSPKSATVAFTNGFANSFTCPRHMCLTCAMETGKNNGRVAKGTMYKCLKCPKSYHANRYCLPASCEIVDGLDIICQAHLSHAEFKKCAEFSCDWCAVCFEGDKFNETPDLIINLKKKQYQGCRPNESLFTCSTCPLSFHPSCYKVSPCTDAWSCKECISGKTICYGDVVWAKMSNYRWWPGRVLPSTELKDKNHNFVSSNHCPGDVAVQFYGLKLVLWVPWYRLLRFEDGEHLSRDYAYRHLTDVYETAVSAASTFHESRTNQKKNELLLDQKSGSRPAPYKHVKTNIPLGGVELMKVPPSESPVCHCVPDEQGFFCGPDSDCINRLMLYECHPIICHGQSKCLNQRFSKRQDADIKPKKTQEKGWGLYAQSPIEKGQFIGEYVGDLIDSKECKRRLEEAQINGIKNFYMLTLDKNRIIDAGPKGNYTRFMNHSCEPNCETQKWTVCGDIRVGLFALKDIPAGTELNFNYNLDCFGNEKTKCKCGSSICSGFLGVRPKTAVAVEIEKKSQETKLRREALASNQQLKKRGRKPKLVV